MERLFIIHEELAYLLIMPAIGDREDSLPLAEMAENIEKWAADNKYILIQVERDALNPLHPNCITLD